MKRWAITSRRSARSRRLLLTAGLVVTTTSLTLSSAAASPSANLPAAASLTNVTLAVPDAIMQWPVEFYMGQTNVCSPYGLKVKTEVTTPTAQSAAITSGSIQFVVGGSQVWEAPLKGVNSVRLVADAGTFPKTGIGAVKSIKTLADLHRLVNTGHTFLVGATTPGGLAELTPVLMLEHDGFKMGKDFSVVYLGQVSATYAAFAGGRYQVGTSNFPPVPVLAAAGVHTLQLLSSIPSLRQLFENFVGVTSSYLSSHRPVVENFLKCFKKAAQDVRSPSHRAALVKAEGQYVAQSPSYISKWIGQVVPITSEIIPTKVSTLVTLMHIFLKYPAAKATVEAKKLIDNSAINAAHVNLPAQGTASG